MRIITPRLPQLTKRRRPDAETVKGWRSLDLRYRAGQIPVWWRAEEAYLSGKIKLGELYHKRDFARVIGSGEIMDMVCVQLELCEFRSPLLMRSVYLKGGKHLYEVCAR